MNESELERLRASSLHYCNKLLNDIGSEQENIEYFFGGEMCKAYVDATDKVLNKTRKVRTKIRNL